jgi:hypothetical protein
MQPGWADDLCRIPQEWRERGDVGRRQLFEEAHPDLSDHVAFRAAVEERLRSTPSLVDIWQNWSWDKRTSPSPYMDGYEVGFFDGSNRQQVRTFGDAVGACSEFIWLETRWMLDVDSRTQ